MTPLPIKRDKNGHFWNCKRATSLRCPVGIACPHGFDVCPQCDACNCAEIEKGTAQS